jgi:AcrR family transcriptional regulator
MLLASMILPEMSVNRPLLLRRTYRPAAPPAKGSTAPAASPWRNRRKARSDRGIKREAVIRAAAQAFNARGFHNTTLDDIAGALEVTKPTLYYYVENKEQLLFECFRAGLEPIRAAIREAGAGSLQARARLRVVLLRYAQAIASEFGWCMVRAEDQDLGAAMQKHVKALKSEIDQGIRRLIREGIADGSIGPCDPKMTSFALAGALNWIAHWYRGDQSLSADQVAERFVSLFEDGLRPRAS